METLRRYLGDPVATWRTGSPLSQGFTALALLLGVGVSFVISVVHYSLMPLTSYYVWLLLGMLLLRFRPLTVLATATGAAAVVAVLLDSPVTTVRITIIISWLVSLALVLFSSSRQQTGLPGPMSEAMLTDLRDRLQSEGTIPELPAGWRAQSAMRAASGVGYGGDFLIARLQGDSARRLELILVDVCGKGVGAAAQALQFGGALGGLIGALPPRELFLAANDFLLRQRSDETFATAAHVVLDLESGDYQMTSAGHPPVLVWSAVRGEWCLDGARGTALGVTREVELHTTTGRLSPGAALLFYTDGMIETRDADLDEGVAWLQRVASAAIVPGFDGAARRIIKQVSRGDDDRAVLILERMPPALVS